MTQCWRPCALGVFSHSMLKAIPRWRHCALTPSRHHHTRSHWQSVHAHGMCTTRQPRPRAQPGSRRRRRCEHASAHCHVFAGGGCNGVSRSLQGDPPRPRVTHRASLRVGCTRLEGGAHQGHRLRPVAADRQRVHECWKERLSKSPRTVRLQRGRRGGWQWSRSSAGCTRARTSRLNALVYFRESVDVRVRQAAGAGADDDHQHMVAQMKQCIKRIEAMDNASDARRATSGPLAYCSGRSSRWAFCPLTLSVMTR